MTATATAALIAGTPVRWTGKGEFYTGIRQGGVAFAIPTSYDTLYIAADADSAQMSVHDLDNVEVVPQEEWTCDMLRTASKIAERVAEGIIGQVAQPIGNPRDWSDEQIVEHVKATRLVRRIGWAWSVLADDRSGNPFNTPNPDRTYHLALVLEGVDTRH